MDDEMDFKALYELSKTELNSMATRLGEFTKAYKEPFEQLQALAETQKGEIDGLKTALHRPPVSEETKDTVSPGMKAFSEFLRKGFESVTDKKALYRTDWQSGGVFAHPEWVNELIRDVTEVSPMRSLVRVRTTGNYSVMVPKYTGSGPAITKVDEKGTKVETPIATPFGLEQVFTHESYAVVDVSQQDVEDADFDLEGFIREEIALQFAAKEGYNILFGTGIGEPFGILDASAGLTSYETAGSNVIASDDILHFYFMLKGAYLPGAKWVMNRGVVEAIAKIKNAVSGDYMWQPGLQNGLEAPLMGKSIVEAPDMPGTLADNDKAVLLGDFNQGYWLIDRKQIEVIRDPLKYAEQGLIRYIARRRQGGRVVKSEALKLMTIKA